MSWERGGREVSGLCRFRGVSVAVGGVEERCLFFAELSSVVSISCWAMVEDMSSIYALRKRLRVVLLVDGRPHLRCHCRHVSSKSLGCGY